jgi:hypothetical protein
MLAITFIYFVSLFFYDATAQVGQGVLIMKALRSHSDTPHSVAQII